MQEGHLPSASVVAGIDGSRVAVRAALWAVDEAVCRDVPLRLICAIPPDATAQIDPQNEARKLATAELAVRYAFMAVESTEKPVKIEVEIIQGSPSRTLLDASRSAALICVGAVGLTHSAPGGVGSTATTLASSAHCPVAIIRGEVRRATPGRGVVVVHVGTSPDDGAVLQAAFEQARLRGMRLHAVTAWHSRPGDVHDNVDVARGNHDLRAQLDRLVEPWARRYPDVEVSSAVVRGGLLAHLAGNSDSIQLIATSTNVVPELTAPAGMAVLQGKDCSVLIVNGRHL
jgi:nucleotide-binding universal stress UspA family protein